MTQKVFLALGGLRENKLCGTSQAMVPTNVKTDHQINIESNLDRLGSLSLQYPQRYEQQSGQVTLQSVLINKAKFLKATRHAKIRKIVIPRSMAVEALSVEWRRCLAGTAVCFGVGFFLQPPKIAIVEVNPLVDAHIQPYFIYFCNRHDFEVRKAGNGDREIFLFVRMISRAPFSSAEKRNQHHNMQLSLPPNVVTPH